MSKDRKDNEILTEMREGFAKMDARFEQVDARFEQVDARFEQVDEKLDVITDRVTGLERSDAVTHERLIKLEYSDSETVRRLTSLEEHVVTGFQRTDERVDELSGQLASTRVEFSVRLDKVEANLSGQIQSLVEPIQHMTRLRSGRKAAGELRDQRLDDHGQRLEALVTIDDASGVRCAEVGYGCLGAFGL